MSCLTFKSVFYLFDVNILPVINDIGLEMLSIWDIDNLCIIVINIVGYPIVHKHIIYIVIFPLVTKQKSNFMYGYAQIMILEVKRS